MAIVGKNGTVTSTPVKLNTPTDNDSIAGASILVTNGGAVMCLGGANVDTGTNCYRLAANASVTLDRAGRQFGIGNSVISDEDLWAVCATSTSYDTLETGV